MIGQYATEICREKTFLSVNESLGFSWPENGHHTHSVCARKYYAPVKTKLLHSWIISVSFQENLQPSWFFSGQTRVEKLRRNRSKNCHFWSTFVDFVGFLCRKCRLSTFSSVLSVFDVRSVDYRRFLSVLSVSICFKYKRNREQLRDKWCSGGEGG